VGWSGELGYGTRAPEPTQADADHVTPSADELAEVHDTVPYDDAHAGEHTH
jgi:hypothetical protein